jgi:hypothetical protein
MPPFDGPGGSYQQPLVTYDPATLDAAIAAHPWSQMTQETFKGAAAPADTVAQMVACVNQAALNYPLPFTDIIVPAYPSAGAPAGGIPDHRFDARFDASLLSVLQGLSSASWWNWFRNGEPAGELPVDFAMRPNQFSPHYPWSLDFRPGGHGRDLRIGGVDVDTAAGGQTAGSGLFPVVLWPPSDNVSNPVAVIDRTREVVQAVLLGDNKDDNRDVLVVTNADSQGDSPWGGLQRTVNVKKVDPFPGGIRSAYDRALFELRHQEQRRQISADARVGATIQYGPSQRAGFVDLGDLITVVVDDERDDVQIVGVKVTIGNGQVGERVELELGALDGSRFQGRTEFERIADLIEEAKKKAEESESGE